MIISDSFVKSVKARDMKFTTNSGTGIYYSYLVLINQAGGLYWRILSEFVSVQSERSEVCTYDRSQDFPRLTKRRVVQYAQTIMTCILASSFLHDFSFQVVHRKMYPV